MWVGTGQLELRSDLMVTEELIEVCQEGVVEASAQAISEQLVAPILRHKIH
jgi:hypothetical protein